jgi:nicotinamidase-related amidase
MKVEHAPELWQLTPGTLEIVEPLSTATGTINLLIAKVAKHLKAAEDTAIFIVHACKSHKKLLEALEMAIGLIRIHHGEAGWETYEKHCIAMRIINGALAEARGAS